MIDEKEVTAYVMIPRCRLIVNISCAAIVRDNAAIFHVRLSFVTMRLKLRQLAAKIPCKCGSRGGIYTDHHIPVAVLIGTSEIFV